MARGWRVAKSLDQLLKQLNERYPKRSKSSDGGIGNAEHASRSSDHNPWLVIGGIGVVTARDYTHDPVGGLDSYALANHLQAFWDDRVKYIISNGRIANAESVTKGGKKYLPHAWSPYHGTNMHTHHVHVSVLPIEKLLDSTRPWNIDFKPGKIVGPSRLVKPTLRPGMVGPAVKEVQTILELKDRDGVFGPATKAAVIEFQKNNGLVADGVVGPYTWDAFLKGQPA